MEHTVTRSHTNAKIGIGILTMFLLLSGSISYSQTDDFCATPPSTIADPPGVYSQSADVNYSNSFSKKTFNIFFWRINKSDGTYTQPGWPITLERVKDGVKRINEQYAPLNICFVLVGMDTINSTAHHTGASLSSIKAYASQNGKVKSNSFNVYAPHTLIRGSGQSGYYSLSLAINSTQVDRGTVFAHELGHSFNLIHTFGNSNDKPPTNCERVTRNPFDTFYNAHEAGDIIVDTDAVPNFQREQQVYFANALVQANIGYTWYQAWNIAFLPNGYRDQLDAIAIEQALLDYGFFQSEVNYLKYNPAKNDAYTDIQNCVYDPDSRINDPNSPFFKDCGGTPYQISTGDMKNFMAYSTTSCDRVFTIGQKVRVHEAIEKVNSPLQTAITENSLDLYIRDAETDIGQEPNIHTDILWNSKDIWVRNQNDGTVVQQHQNPIYSPINSNYVYVKVRNKGCGTSSGNEQLKLYWAKASTALNWDDYWTGQISFNGVSMGDELGALSIPVLAPDEETILEFQWTVPNPQDYIEINPNPWHFCLLARMVSNDDPMTFPEVTSITENVKNNNNIAWKNTTIIEISPNTSEIGAVIGVNNPLAVSRKYSLELYADIHESGKKIYQEAEIGIEMDSILYDAWESGNSIGENFTTTSNDYKILATGNNVLIDEIDLGANEYGTAYITFNFLTKELTNKQYYEYQVVQRDKVTNEIIGGESFEIKKQPRAGFIADAGDNPQIERNQSVTLIASIINENAVYNWYEPEGNLIYTGTDLTVTPQITQKYKLEIISDLDGLKDYDDVVVTVNPHRIISMTPNPLSSLLTINYITDGVTSAYIMIVNQITGITDNYILDNTVTEVTFDLTTNPTGLYSIILVCDGEVRDSKTLAKQ